MHLALTLLAALQAPIAFAHANIIDGRDATPRRDQTIVVRGNRILSVGPAATNKVPPNASIIDARGKYLIPGLWDMHVHTTIIGGRDCSRSTPRTASPASATWPAIGILSRSGADSSRAERSSDRA